MVDAAAQFSPIDAAPRAEAKAAVVDLHDYARLAAQSQVAPPQTPLWVEAWSTKAGTECVILHAGRAEGVQVFLPLEIVGFGPFRVARLMGGSHAAGNFPPSRGEGEIGADDIRRAIRSARPDVDLVRLERLAFEQGGVGNPLRHLPHSESPNIALAVCLDGGFDALLDRASGKRKRKKHRSQTRKFDAAGGVRRIEARSADEVDAILARFFDMKAQRFRKMGIADVFAPAGVQAFFRQLFTQALAQTPPPFTLHALEVGGVIRAVTGSSGAGDRLVCEFGAIAEDEMSSASPGEFLFFENIREACEQGFAIYDFSVGDEPYKRLWCNIETRHFDVVLPVSLKGHALAAGLRAITALKRAVKQNRAVWGAVKRLRRKTAATAQAAAEDD